MALVQCKECSVPVAENAEFCPKCGFKAERPKERLWVATLIKAIPGSLVISVATAFLAYLTFFYQKETQESEKLQSMIESAVSDNAVKERTAIQVVTYLAKQHELSPHFALSILGTVVRNGGDEKLHGEVYDAIENLTGGSSFDKFDKYEKLEVLCLKAALTPAQHQRWTNIGRIEETVTGDGLKLQAASKLLSLTQILSDPQTVIDLLLSASVCDSDPDMIEKLIPSLSKIVKLRDHFGNQSNQDVAGCLEIVAKNIDLMKPDIREATRSKIRLYLARALIAKDKDLREDSLKTIEKLVTSADLDDDVRLLLDGVGRTTEDPNLAGVVDTVSTFLAREKNAGARKITHG